MKTMKTVYGFKEGCTWCGKPMTSKGWFNPLYTPTVHSCSRRWCMFKRRTKPKVISFFRVPIKWLKKRIDSLEREL